MDGPLTIYFDLHGCKHLFHGPLHQPQPLVHVVAILSNPALRRVTPGSVSIEEVAALTHE